jgi:hypothetical protein
MAVNPTLMVSRSSNPSASAAFGLSLLLLAIVALFACWLVGTRSIETGFDTSTYVGFFEGVAQGPIDTRLEPGFVAITYALNRAGIGVTAYLETLFGIMLLTVVIATRKYFRFLEGTRDYLTFLSASLAMLFVSPMFVNASINAVRQGLASLLVFTALLCFHQRKWFRFVLYGALASSLHFSSLLYIAFAPALLLSTRALRYVAGAAFLVYCSGLSMTLVHALVPSLYNTVMEYSAHDRYQAGTRVDFAVFSIFWYLLPYFAGGLVEPHYREKIRESTSIYLVMLLPFFAIGWGYFSNRYLLPAWLATSLIVAAMICNSRLKLLRSPALIRLALIGSCAVFYVYVTRGIVI